MPKRRPRDPFDVTFPTERSDPSNPAQTREDFESFLCTEVQAALDARSTLVADDGLLDYWHELYEQGSSKISKNTPWPGAADLTSYIGTEKIDALRARMMKTIFGEPVCVVEGSGDSAGRAPYVEEFHQWAVEKVERLQGRLGRGVHNALVEGVGVLYTSERTETITHTETQHVLAAQNEQGGLILGPDNLPTEARDEDGFVIPAQPGRPSIEGVVKWEELRAKGPRTRVISLKDFVQLPGHATDREDVWGYAHRFWRRLSDLEAKQDEGIYSGVERLGEATERTQRPREAALGQDIATVQHRQTAEKELWEVYFLWDFGSGPQWHLATVSLTHRVMLRLKVDDLGRPRYNLLIPAPMPNSVYGYSQIGHKLGTIIEEHTAERNMIADRSALAVAAPIKVLQGSIWDSEAEPFGPLREIHVRSMDEVQPMVIPDVPMSMFNQRTHTEAAAERIAGVSDVAATGVVSVEKRTLGEQQMAAAASAVRMDEAIANMQEAIEELYELRHEIWKRTLRQDVRGMKVPASVSDNLSLRGLSLDANRITADLLEGEFRFKPRNSVDTADPIKKRADFNGLLMALGALAKGSPAVIGAWLSRPGPSKALLDETANLYRFQNKKGLVGTQDEWNQFLQEMQAQAQAQAQMAQVAQMMTSLQPSPPGSPGARPNPGGPRMPSGSPTGAPPAPPM